jgi:hypothetical protein
VKESIEEKWESSREVSKKGKIFPVAVLHADGTASRVDTKRAASGRFLGFRLG